MAQMIKNLPAVQKTQVPSLHQEDPLEKGEAIHSFQYSCLENPWTEEPGGKTQVPSLHQEDPLEKGEAIHSFQYSCLENPMDRGAWWATVHRVAKSRA